jgi:hypothetical protein
MAKVAANDFPAAERLLDRGYGEASNWEKSRGVPYNRKQLDDRKAKFLISRAKQTHRLPNDMFKDAVVSFQTWHRIMQDKELTHHPYETLVMIADLLVLKGSMLIGERRLALISQLEVALQVAERRLTEVSDGYQRHAAEQSLSGAKTRGAQLAATR